MEVTLWHLAGSKSKEKKKPRKGGWAVFWGEVSNYAWGEFVSRTVPVF